MDRRARIIKLAMALNPTHFLTTNLFDEQMHGPYAKRAAEFLGKRSREGESALEDLTKELSVVNRALNAKVNEEHLAKLTAAAGGQAYGTVNVQGKPLRLSLTLGDAPSGWKATTKDKAHVNTFYTDSMGKIKEEAEDLEARSTRRKVPIQEYVDRYLEAEGGRYNKRGGWNG